MRIHQKLLIAAILAASAIIPVATSEAQGISISIGDRAYYRGDSYWHRGSRVYWVPGYWGPRRTWVHGRYVRRSDPYYRSYYRNRAIAVRAIAIRTIAIRAFPFGTTAARFVSAGSANQT